MAETSEVAANPMSGLPSAIGNTAVGLYQLYQGRQQGKRYDEIMKTLKDPIYQIAPESTSALNLATNLAEPKTFAGQNYAEQNIDQAIARGTSGAVRAATSSQDLLGAITSMAGKEMDSRNQLMEFAARDYMNRQNKLIEEKKAYALEQKEKQERDVYDKFGRDSAAASAYRAGELYNTSQGLKGIVGGAAGIASSTIPGLGPLTSL